MNVVAKTIDSKGGGRDGSSSRVVEHVNVQSGA